MNARRFAHLLQEIPHWFRRIPDFSIRRKRHRCLAALGVLVLAGASLPFLQHLRQEARELPRTMTLVEPLLHAVPLPGIELHEGRSYYMIRSEQRVYRVARIHS